LVLALPRGGVPVGFEIARALGVPLDVFLVRKLGAPGQEELALGAIASGGVRVLQAEVVRALHIDAATIDAIAEHERVELERRSRLYRDNRPELDVRGRTLILIDDGLATGSTMRAAVAALRSLGPARIVIAVPVAPIEACRELREEVDEVVCAATPPNFVAVGQWYDEFPQTSDEEVRQLLAEASDRLDRPAA
jgi:predicted phosphoribosyltransferase